MKKVLLIIVAILILLAIPVTVFLAAQRQELRKRAAPATTLSLSPASISKKVGDTFSLEVKIDPGENQVVAAEIHVTFDPEKLSVGTIKNGAAFPNILTDSVVASGSASIQLGAPSTSQPVTQPGTVAVFEFTALKQTETGNPTTVRFASTTFVGGLGESNPNVLVGTTPAKVTITEGSEVSAGAQESTESANLAPTQTLAPESTGSATTSAIQIVTPAKNASVTSEQPTFTGKAPPGATVTLIIRSDPVTVTVTADANGNWSYTPTAPLASGTHSVVASATDPTTGTTLTTTNSFVVASGGSGTSSQSATPVSGSFETTLLLLGLGAILFFSGFIIPFAIR